MTRARAHAQKTQNLRLQLANPLFELLPDAHTAFQKIIEGLTMRMLEGPRQAHEDAPPG